jgi:hypothetical protein
VTIAVDRTNGKVIGQVTTIAPDIARSLMAGARSDVEYRSLWRVASKGMEGYLCLLTRNGYRSVPADSVRVEKVR